MKTITSYTRIERKTRFLFRVLAGVIAAFVLLVSLPLAMLEGIDGGGWQAWVLALCSLFAGIGMVVGARTGHWPFSPRSARGND